jgi:diaminopimelate decarboxylase
VRGASPGTALLSCPPVKAGFSRDDDGVLLCDGVSLERLAAETGTPAYVYSRAAIEEAFRRFDAAFASVRHLVCYATKANANLSILKILAGLGAGADVVSGGELRAALEAGIPAGRIVFSGAGKTDEEIELGLAAGLLAFNVESRRELEKIDRAAAARRTIARVALRINPDIDSGSHPHIVTGMKHNKFGMDSAEARRIFADAAGFPSCRLTGLQAHIGSQILDTAPLAAVARDLAALASDLSAAGASLETLDLGGGVGVSEAGDDSLSPEAYAAAALPEVRALPLRILIEPGRSILARAGALLTRVLYVKENSARTFVVVDAAMNDFLRPALYAATHRVEPVRRSSPGKPVLADVVGPVCETGDFFARDAEIERPEEGNLLAVRDAGAYGFAMASNYNFRPRAAEVLVEDGAPRVIRRRETWEDLVRLERE